MAATNRKVELTLHLPPSSKGTPGKVWQLYRALAISRTCEGDEGRLLRWQPLCRLQCSVLLGWEALTAPKCIKGTLTG